VDSDRPTGPRQKAANAAHQRFMHRLYSEGHIGRPLICRPQEFVDRIDNINALSPVGGWAEGNELLYEAFPKNAPQLLRAPFLNRASSRASAM
jgi:hypothetical protein